MNRLYLVVIKIKDLAREKAKDGSKDVNFDQLVTYLSELDGESN